MPRSRSSSARASSHRGLRIRGARTATALVVGALAISAGAGPVGAQGPKPPDDNRSAALAEAASWLTQQQQPDGSFGAAAFTLGATSESVLALGEQAQTSDEWIPRRAVDRMIALADGDGGTNPLDAIDRLSEGALTVVEAAVLITDVAAPLALDPTSFDPAANGGQIDLVEIVEAVRPRDDLGTLTVAVPALRLAGVTVDPTLTDAIVAARGEDGGWSASGTKSDPETTARAVMALVGGGVDPGAEPVRGGLRQLASQRRSNGTWGSGASSVTATALAVLALRAGGFDPGSSCWITSLGAAETEMAPVDALLGQQEGDGRFGKGGEVLGTTTAMHALSGGWLPIGAPEIETCDRGIEWPLPVPPSFLVLGLIGGAGVAGGFRIMKDTQAA